MPGAVIQRRARREIILVVMRKVRLLLLAVFSGTARKAFFSAARQRSGHRSRQPAPLSRQRGKYVQEADAVSAGNGAARHN